MVITEYFLAGALLELLFTHIHKDMSKLPQIIVRIV